MSISTPESDGMYPVLFRNNYAFSLRPLSITNFLRTTRRKYRDEKKSDFRTFKKQVV